jgi:hypothetical protein
MIFENDDEPMTPRCRSGQRSETPSRLALTTLGAAQEQKYLERF